VPSTPNLPFPPPPAKNYSTILPYEKYGSRCDSYDESSYTFILKNNII
jgi:hypothetical protein